MDTYQPLWAEPIISIAAYVAVGDRLLCRVAEYSAEVDYYEVVDRRLASEVLVFKIHEELGDGVSSRRTIVKRKDESVAYQKRLE